jgi:hypothetical protein
MRRDIVVVLQELQNILMIWWMRAPSDLTSVARPHFDCGHFHLKHPTSTSPTGESIIRTDLPFQWPTRPLSLCCKLISSYFISPLVPSEFSTQRNSTLIFRFCARATKIELQATKQKFRLVAQVFLHDYLVELILASFGLRKWISLPWNRAQAPQPFPA